MAMEAGSVEGATHVQHRAGLIHRPGRTPATHVMDGWPQPADMGVMLLGINLRISCEHIVVAHSNIMLCISLATFVRVVSVESCASELHECWCVGAGQKQPGRTGPLLIFGISNIPMS